MGEEPDNLVLIVLRRLDSKVDQVLLTQADHGRRLTALEWP
jgi:hypothetical protein